jgi:hypothetical protein
MLGWSKDVATWRVSGRMASASSSYSSMKAGRGTLREDDISPGDKQTKDPEFSTQGEYPRQDLMNK